MKEQMTGQVSHEHSQATLTSSKFRKTTTILFPKTLQTIQASWVVWVLLCTELKWKETNCLLTSVRWNILLGSMLWSWEYAGGWLCCSGKYNMPPLWPVEMRRPLFIVMCCCICYSGTLAGFLLIEYKLIRYWVITVANSVNVFWPLIGTIIL